MKRLTRKKITAAGIIAGAMIASSGVMTGCALHIPGITPSPFVEEENMPECVYGPPDYFETETNMQPDVYGPPEFFE